jgi:hypothetical protein
MPLRLFEEALGEGELECSGDTAFQIREPGDRIVVTAYTELLTAGIVGDRERRFAGADPR